MNRAVVLFAVASLMGCASLLKPREAGERFRSAKIEEISQEMGCPQKKLTVIPKTSTEMQVIGCKQQRVYVLKDSTWVQQDPSPAP